MLEKYINYFTNDLPNKTSLFLLCAAFYFLLHSHVFGPLWSFRTIPPFSWAPQAPQQAASTLTLKNPQLASSLLGLQLSSPLFYVSWLVPREILCFQNAPTFLICIQWVSFHSHEFRVKNQCVHCGKVSMLIMPPVPNQVIRWIWKYTRILWVAQHLLPFFFFSNPVLPQLWERTSLGFCLSKWFFWLSYGIRARSRTWEIASVQKATGQNPTVL